ncbi:MFS transporter [Paenibacillus gansuensis]|uniref:MFS transporter n=1 Tax=Paenibacillus gansuensis TaxID=306542 RepID=A0ABW5PLB2_9BACL
MSNTWKIFMLAAVSFLVGTSEFIIGGILDIISKDVNVSIAAAGQLITVYSLSYAFITPILVVLTARIERRKVMIFSLGAFVIGNVIAVAASGFIPLMVSRIILASSTGLFVVVSLTVATSLAKPGKQASAIATLVMGFSFALIIGLPLGRVIAASFDWNLIFVGLGALGVLAMIIIHLAIPRTGGEEPVPLKRQLSLLSDRKIVVALSISFFWIFGYSMAYTYISPFLLTITGMNEREVSIALFAFGLASLIGSKLGGYGTDKWGVSRTLVGGMILHTLALVLLSLGAHSTVIVFPVLLLWAFSTWSTGPTQQYNLMKLSPNASGIVLSLNSSVIHLAFASGAGIGGIVVERISLASVSWLGASGVFVATVIAATTMGMAKSRSRNRATVPGLPNK